MVGPRGKVFRIEVFRRLENAILRLIFADAVLHKIAILLMFCKQNSQKVCCIFLRIYSLLLGPPCLGPKNKMLK